MVSEDFGQGCRRTIDAYMAAFNSRDMDALGRVLTDDATLVDWEVSASGKADVLATTDRIVTGASVRIAVKRVVAEAPCAVADLTVAVNGEIELDVIDLFEFAPDGRISSVRAFKGPERRG